MMFNYKIAKYPRTRHIEGSTQQIGDYDLDIAPFFVLRGRHVVIEEKVDGANCGVSYDNEYRQRLQSRGHYLTGGKRERHFDLFKQWAGFLEDQMLDRLEDRYVQYGEWMYAKHTEFYDLLPHYFMEFDIYDRQTETFLDTSRRIELLNGLPIEHVLVLFEGELESIEHLASLLVDSHFKSPEFLKRLREQCDKYSAREDVANELFEGTDHSLLMEGLYIKVEEDGVVKERYKYVRGDFVQIITSSDEHWLDRPIVPNLLRPDIDLWRLT